MNAVMPSPGRGIATLLHGGWRGCLLALLAGALLPLAFAPFDFIFLAVLAPALLFALWLQVSPGQAFARGYLFGVGMFGVGVSWVFVSMYENGGVGLAMSLFLTGFFVLFLSLFPAMLGYGLARFLPWRHPAAQRLKLLLLFPVAWVLWEWVRGWFFTGFPWLALGYSQIDGPLAGVAPLLGVYGVSLAVALSAGWLVLLLRDGWVWRGAAALSLSIVLGGAVALNKVSWVQPVGVPLKVTLLQGNIPQDMKWLWDLRDPTLELYTNLTRASWDSDLIVWPETAVPALYHEVEDFFDGLAAEADRHGSALLIGVIYQEPNAGPYYNSVVSVGGATPRQFYHKRHLVPFTEYLPLENVLGGLVKFMQVPMSDFSKGTSAAPLRVAGQHAGVSICYEDAFGEEAIGSLPEATLLVNVTNDAWFGHSIAPQQHLQMARMRALEAGRPLLRATNTGLTAVMDERGRVLSQAPQFEVYALHDTVQPMQGLTPYGRFGNVPVVTTVLIFMVGGWLILRRVKPR